MQLSTLRPVYAHDGPFATVYLEGRSPGEDSSEQLRLRWRALRDRLESAGADAATADAIEAELRVDDPGEPQTDGRVLVAAGGTVLLAEPWDAAIGAGDDAHWGEEPELGAFVRESARAVRVLVVVTDQQGAQVRQEVIAEQHEPREVDAEVVAGGSAEGVHKPRQGALSHNQIQRRAEEAVGRNARDIVAHLHSVASRFRPDVLVLAGEVQGRTAVREELPAGLSGMLVEAQSGGRDEGASDEALADELLAIAARRSASAASEHTERLQAGMAHDNAVQGHQPVADAAEQGAVETLLFTLDGAAHDESALLRACAQTDSSAGLVEDGTPLTDNVAALLRFPVQR